MRLQPNATFISMRSVSVMLKAWIDNSFEKKLDWAASLGFDVVEHIRVTEDTIRGEIEKFSKKIEQFDLPSDGLVLVYDDLAYGKSLGRTAKFPRDSIAFKWADETAETTLTEIEWTIKNRTDQSSGNF